jgi:hypothetical protein
LLFRDNTTGEIAFSRCRSDRATTLHRLPFILSISKRYLSSSSHLKFRADTVVVLHDQSLTSSSSFFLTNHTATPHTPSEISHQAVRPPAARQRYRPPWTLKLEGEYTQSTVAIMTMNASYASPTADAQVPIYSATFDGLLARFAQGWSIGSVLLTLFLGLVVYDQCTYR